MRNSKLVLLLTTALALGAPTDVQVVALDQWASGHVKSLVDKGMQLLKPPFSRAELDALADETVKAADELRTIFKGTERAKIAQTVLVVVVKDICPDNVEQWILPFLQGDEVANLIEAAFQRVFPERAQENAGAAPVVDASDVEPGGIQ